MFVFPGGAELAFSLTAGDAAGTPDSRLSLCVLI